jgi:hypothetical protein
MMEDLLKLLNLENADDELRARLQTIVDITSDRLKNRLGTDEVPSGLAYIVTEVSIIRFNRIGSEGLSSHTVEGESMGWTEDDFSAYESDIQAWIDENKDTSRRGRIRFI